MGVTGVITPVVLCATTIILSSRNIKVAVSNYTLTHSLCNTTYLLLLIHHLGRHLTSHLWRAVPSYRVLFGGKLSIPWGKLSGGRILYSRDCPCQGAPRVRPWLFRFRIFFGARPRVVQPRAVARRYPFIIPY